MTLDPIAEAAAAIIERYGPERAAEHAREHADRLTGAGDLKAADIGWLVLSEVERRLSEARGR